MADLSTSPPSESSAPFTYSFLEVDGGDLLSNWEIVDPSDDDAEDYSFDDADADDDDGFQILAPNPCSDHPISDHRGGDGEIRDMVVKLDEPRFEQFEVADGFRFLTAKPVSDHPISDHRDGDGEIRDVVVKLDEPRIEKFEIDDHDDDVGEGVDEDDDGDDGFDLDDELVPYGVSDRFGRQRLRKLGKRAYPKMKNSKRLPYYYSRPGCVHGKHGLGLKHSII